MSYQFYLDDILLPVTPAELSIKVGDKNETIELLNDKDLILLRNPSLSEISFTALLPAQQVGYAVYENNIFESSNEILSKIQKLKYDKKKFLFSVIRRINDKTYFDTVIKVVLSDYDVKESADEAFDLVVSINLKEFKDASTQIGKITQDEKGNAIIQYERAVPSEELKIGSVHVVKNEAETLWKIAKKFYDDGSKYKDLKIVETPQEWSALENNGPNYLKVNQEILLLEKKLSKGG